LKRSSVLDVYDDILFMLKPSFLTREIGNSDTCLIFKTSCQMCTRIDSVSGNAFAPRTHWKSSGA